MIKNNPHNSPSYAGFAQQLVTLALPVLAQGYRGLVNGFRNDQALAQVVKERGIDAVLSDKDALKNLRKGNNELVTAGEKEAESVMRRAVQESFPEHAITGEEWGVQKGSETRWVFDPVDGTSAMVKTALAEAFGARLGHPVPAFGITIAVVEGNEAIVGVVAELKPQAGSLGLARLWVGEKGSVMCDGKRVSVSLLPPAVLKSALLACTVPEVMFGTGRKWSGYQALADAVAGSVPEQNCIGFMRLMMKDGGVDIAYESDLAYHDAAALVPLLQGAGIKVTDGEGRPLDFSEGAIGKEFTLLAAQPPLHAEALALIRKGVPPEKNRFSSCQGNSQGYANKFPDSQ